MLCFSVAHSPKSISWQRSLQKGRKRLSLDQATGFWQPGQFTVLLLSLSIRFCQPEKLFVQHTHLLVDFLDSPLIVNDFIRCIQSLITAYL